MDYSIPDINTTIYLPENHVQNTKQDAEAKMWNAMRSTADKNVDEDGNWVETMSKEVQRLLRWSGQQMGLNHNFKESNAFEKIMYLQQERSKFIDILLTWV